MLFFDLSLRRIINKDLGRIGRLIVESELQIGKLKMSGALFTWL